MRPITFLTITLSVVFLAGCGRETSQSSEGLNLSREQRVSDRESDGEDRMSLREQLELFRSVDREGGVLANRPSRGEKATGGSVCAWGMGIFSSQSEFKSYIQSLAFSGKLNHCVTVDGTRLNLTAPNGLFGPCVGAVSQAGATYAVWANCVSHVQ